MSTDQEEPEAASFNAWSLGLLEQPLTSEVPCFLLLGPALLPQLGVQPQGGQVGAKEGCAASAARFKPQLWRLSDAWAATFA